MMQTISLDQLHDVAPGAQCTFVCVDREDDLTAYGPVSSPTMDAIGGWFEYAGQDDLDARLDEITEHNDFTDDDMLVLVIVFTEPTGGNGSEPWRPRVYLTPFNLRDVDDTGDEDEEEGEYEEEGDDDGGSGARPAVNWIDQE